MQDKKPDAPVSEDSNLVIVTTPEYVKDSIKEAIAEHAASRNHPYATQAEPGFVTLSNAVDNDSEITVATSKAVKKAYDLANTANLNALNNNSDLYLEKKQNGADIPNKEAFVENIGLTATVNLAKNALQRGEFGFGGEGERIGISDYTQMLSWLRNKGPSKIYRNDGINSFTHQYGVSFKSFSNDTWANLSVAYNGDGVKFAGGNDSQEYIYDCLVSRKAIVNSSEGGNNNIPDNDYNNIPINQTFFGYSGGNNSANITGSGIHISGMGRYSFQLMTEYWRTGAIAYRSFNADMPNQWNKWEYIRTTSNTMIDSNGFLQHSSPIVNIWSNGKFETNTESEGATVEHISKGTYLINGILNIEIDAEWGGLSNGIEIPLCRNKLPLIWVDYEILSDSSIKIMTYHREHSDAPIFARNIREGYAEGDLIDIPDGRFISVRVQMPAVKSE
ncbi:tail fiber protein [Xenorhabdus sp. PB30.3]|uniref:phage tail fiber protein n=1 Tax=Xenorhabdus sp. PB30.3 TaxID=2788941 RepID=UPI001E3823E2|nr:phage tail protein [Xenorhabdus sp. PB30.3]MCC8381902.1 tail fiber protein [Xenorhabdus sp. PB30.3]